MQALLAEERLEQQRQSHRKLLEEAGQAGRYDEVLEQLQALIPLGKLQLTTRERDLLSLASQHAVGRRRRELQQLMALSPEERQAVVLESNKDVMPESKTQSHEDKLRREILDLCRGIVSLARHQLALDLDSVCIVFFHKVLADHARYIAWFADGSIKDTAVAQASSAYQQASLEAIANLDASHPFRVALALNFAVFTYDVLRKRTEAISIAQTALDDATDGAGGVREASGGSIAAMLQSLEDNIVDWSAELESPPPSDVVDEVLPAEVPPADVDCWSRPGETELSSIKRIMASSLDGLKSDGHVIPDNVQPVGQCTEPHHNCCVVFQFGTKLVHVTARVAGAGRLCVICGTACGRLLVVRCGGGFLDFVEYVKKHGNLEALQLARRTEAQGQSASRLNSTLSDGRARITEAVPSLPPIARSARTSRPQAEASTPSSRFSRNGSQTARTPRGGQSLRATRTLRSAR